MSLWAVSGGAVWEAPRQPLPQPPRDPERPSGPLRVVEGREADAARAARALAVLHEITGDESLQIAGVKALLRAGIVEVDRG